MQDSNYLTLEQNENFPACFPDDFEQNILPHDVEFRAYHAYRILKMGTLDRNAFISSFEEFKDNTYKPRGFNIRSPETFSTSVLSDLQDAKNLLKFMCRHHPHPLIAEGFTEPSCGPCKKSYNSTHINWWLFKNAHPEYFFKVVELDE